MVAFCALADPQADANEVYATPLWAMLGWFEPGDIDAWAGQRGKVLLWMYVMVSNVLLVNLLIAMMGDTCARPHVPPPLISDSLEARGRTGHSAPRAVAPHRYAHIKENSDMEWKFARLASGIEYAADHPHALRLHPHRHHPHSAARLAARYVERVHSVPPPFSLPIMLNNFYRWVRGHRWETEGDGKDDGIDDWAENPVGKLRKAKKEKDLIAEWVLRERRAKARSSSSARLACRPCGPEPPSPPRPRRPPFHATSSPPTSQAEQSKEEELAENDLAGLVTGQIEQLESELKAVQRQAHHHRLPRHHHLPRHHRLRHRHPYYRHRYHLASLRGHPPAAAAPKSGRWATSSLRSAASWRWCTASMPARRTTRAPARAATTITARPAARGG